MLYILKRAVRSPPSPTFSRCARTRRSEQHVVYLNADSNNECGSKTVRFTNTSAASLKMVFAALLAYDAQGLPVQFSIASCSGSSGVFEYIDGVAH